MLTAPRLRGDRIAGEAWRVLVLDGLHGVPLIVNPILGLV
jgi:hypothetical protein